MAQRAQENKLEVEEMRMLKWLCGVSEYDRMRNEKMK
jgi:hypothetical protein